MKTLTLSIFTLFIFGEMSAQTPATKKNVLIVYYSYSGNTRVVANQIKELTSGDLFEIQPQKPYSPDYKSVANQAKSELKLGVLPALKAKPDSLEKYDVILIGSPCWWSTMAPPLFTFLSSYDFSGKTIALFMTHGGSGLGHSIADIKKKCPSSVIQKGLAVYGDSVSRAKPDLAKWLHEIAVLNK